MSHPTLTLRDTPAGEEARTDEAPPEPGVIRLGDKIVRQRAWTALDRARFRRHFGHHNPEYRAFLAVYYIVSAIDGEAVAPPVGDLQMEALIQRLGDEFAELVDAVTMAGPDEIAALRDEADQERRHVKNL
jgi:hypothetical protein